MDRLIAHTALALVLRERAARAARAADSGDPGARRRRRALGRGTVPASRVFGVAFVACMMGDAAWYLAGQALRPPVMKLLVPGVPFSRFLCAPDEFRFERWGKADVVVSKFISGLSTIRALAGATRLGWPSFSVLQRRGRW